LITNVDKIGFGMNNQPMAKSDPDRDIYNRAVRDHIVSILDTGVRRQVMANALFVTRAAISSYVKGRTTPKPIIIERLLMRWPVQLPFRGQSFGVGAYGSSTPRPKSVPYQRDLFSALSSIPPENLRIEAQRASATDVELTILIKVAG
jgi:hypothetical protein